MTAPEFIPRTRSGPIEAGTSARKRASALDSHYGHRSNGGPEVTDGIIDLLREILAVPDGMDARWMLDALCAQVEAGVFHPDKGGTADHARDICALCPVKAECLDWAVNVPWYELGVWGGVSERQRRVLRRARGLDVPEVPADADTEDVPGVAA